MADPGKIYPAEFHLLKKELEIQGELLNKERLERRTEIDRLRIEVESIKQLLEFLYPGSSVELQKFLDKDRQAWNPELEKKRG